MLQSLNKPCYVRQSELAMDPERTLDKVLCSSDTESIADFVSQLIPTLSLCSSVGNLIK